ncbi:MAG: GNAT family N-acetyltransferase [Thermoplasmata archaeon]|nr:GNAT family N-acetyltransferase [Thermoplasmata archaeon]
MKIYDLRGLPKSLLPQLAAFGVVEGDPSQDIVFIRRLLQLGLPSSKYFAVYAVDQGQVLSRVETLSLGFVGHGGPQPVVGISDVLTRPDGSGRGFARALLEEVHRREVAAGRKWSFLWTHPSWGAHRLYESLGYTDVYSPPVALRPVRSGLRRTPPRGYHWTVARAEDASRLERLLWSATAQRWGFVPRFPGSFRLRFGVGWRKPANHRILLRGSRSVGYVHLGAVDRWRVVANEVVVVPGESAESMLDALEGIARGRWLVLGMTSFTRDAAPLLESRGYSIHAKTHETLMAKRLASGSSLGDDVGPDCEDPRFSSHRGDMF